LSLRDKLLKNSTVPATDILEDSKFFTEKEVIPTAIPMVNVALSGRLDGGISCGLTMLAGVSKNFKTGFALLLASSFLNYHKDGIVLFYDSEFGTPEAYFKTFQIDKSRVVHTPIVNVEQLKFDLMQQLEGLTKDDNVMIVVDSIGNLASKKELEDAIEGKSVADMSRAKSLKSLFRIVTPHLNLKNIPMVAINHTYKEISLFPKDIVGGGTGSYYSSETIWIIGRQQEKQDKDIVGYHFVINIEKSRHVKEKSKIPITVMFDGGIDKWSGLLDLALEAGILEKQGRSYMFNGEKYGPNSLNNVFWTKVLANSSLAEFIEKKYKLVTDNQIIAEEEKEDAV
jgi:RecA/RadA recombinase